MMVPTFWYRVLILVAVLAILKSNWSPSTKVVRQRLAGSSSSRAATTQWVPAWFEQRAHSADLAPAVLWWRVLLAVAALVGLVAFFLGGLPLAAMATGGMVGAGFLGLSAASDRRGRNLAAEVPEALELMARSCRAGSSIVAAMASLGQHPSCRAGVLFSAVAERVEQGQSLAAGLDELVQSNPLPPFRMAAAALLVGAETGAAPARAMEGVAATLRDNAALARESHALASQARYSAAVLVLAPIGFALFSISADNRVAEFLFRTPLGLAVMAAGLALDSVGAWWMAQLVKTS